MYHYYLLRLWEKRKERGEKCTQLVTLKEKMRTEKIWRKITWVEGKGKKMVVGCS